MSQTEDLIIRVIKDPVIIENNSISTLKSLLPSFRRYLKDELLVNKYDEMYAYLGESYKEMVEITRQAIKKIEDM